MLHVTRKNNTSCHRSVIGRAVVCIAYLLLFARSAGPRHLTPTLVTARRVTTTFSNLGELPVLATHESALTLTCYNLAHLALSILPAASP
eukprot:6452242-Pyramimonas_sp.AAC.1